MNRELLYFILALGAIYLIFDQFVGNKAVGKLVTALWNGGSVEDEGEQDKSSGALADDDVQFAGNGVYQGTQGKWSSQVISAVATAGNIRS